MSRALSSFNKNCLISRFQSTSLQAIDKRTWAPFELFELSWSTRCCWNKEPNNDTNRWVRRADLEYMYVSLCRWIFRGVIGSPTHGRHAIQRHLLMASITIKWFKVDASLSSRADPDAGGPSFLVVPSRLLKATRNDNRGCACCFCHTEVIAMFLLLTRGDTVIFVGGHISLKDIIFVKWGNPREFCGAYRFACRAQKPPSYR